ncbi:MAG: hypothetical protein ACOX9R_11415 [Armatimonadota bacterium]
MIIGVVVVLLVGTTGARLLQRPETSGSAGREVAISAVMPILRGHKHVAVSGTITAFNERFSKLTVRPDNIPTAELEVKLGQTLPSLVIGNECTAIGLLRHYSYGFYTLEDAVLAPGSSSHQVATPQELGVYLEAIQGDAIVVARGRVTNASVLKDVARYDGPPEDVPVLDLICYDGLSSDTFSLNVFLGGEVLPDGLRNGSVVEVSGRLKDFAGLSLHDATLRGR